MTAPGTAIVRRHADGTRTVLSADPLIRVANELLDGELDTDVIEPDGTLRLDTAGEYRYRYVRDGFGHTRIYERITEQERAG